MESATNAIRCHRCSQFCGEASRPMEFVGVVRLKEDVDLVDHPRDTWKCKCGWTNIFRPIAKAA
jgi:hypothetical protein